MHFSGVSATISSPVPTLFPHIVSSTHGGCHQVTIHRDGYLTFEEDVESRTSITWTQLGLDSVKKELPGLPNGPPQVLALQKCVSSIGKSTVTRVWRWGVRVLHLM